LCLAGNQLGPAASAAGLFTHLGGPWQALPTDPRVGVWTDDYCNPLSVFRWYQ
jgi:hypothetical protein